MLNICVLNLCWVGPQLILGLPFKRDVLEHHVMAIDKSGQHMVDFPTFYEWWQQGGMAD